MIVISLFMLKSINLLIFKLQTILSFYLNILLSRRDKNFDYSLITQEKKNKTIQTTGQLIPVICYEQCDAHFYQYKTNYSAQVNKTF